MNQFVSRLIQFYKRNEKLFEKLLMKWQIKFTDKEIDRQTRTREMIGRNHTILERVIGNLTRN